MCQLSVARGKWNSGATWGSGRCCRHIVFWSRRWGLSRHGGHSVGKEDWGVGTCVVLP